MDHVLTWCEIPVTDMERAKAFYADVLGVEFIEEDMGLIKMAMFKTASPEIISGALVQGEGYKPSKTASIAYLSGGKDLAPALKRATNHGAEVLFPKTPIKEGEGGYFAQVTDCEGNRIGLYSPA